MPCSTWGAHNILVWGFDNCHSHMNQELQEESAVAMDPMDDMDAMDTVDTDTDESGTSTPTEGSTTPSPSPGATSKSSDSVTKEELLDLVRAIKFAKPEASMRQVHKEITETLSVDHSFAFLSEIPLTDVKKVWKKAVTESSVKRQQRDPPSMESLPELLGADNHGEPWKLYTVGDGSVHSLAQEYSQTAAKEAAAAAMQQKQNDAAAEDEEQALLWKHYVHVFLNVPADLSGQRPHQAIINFNQNSVHRSTTNAPTTSTSTAAAAAARSATGTKSATASNTTKKNVVICKIQVAASSGGTKYPMLLYNQDRTIKTFIHPDDDATTTNTKNDNNDDGYDRLFRIITTRGVGGALGAMGGTKAYFFATKHTIARAEGTTEEVLSIDTRRLADAQGW